MARAFASTDSISLAAGGLAGATRAQTVVALLQVSAAGAGLMSGSASASHVWSFGFDSGKPFGDGDFGAGGPSVPTGTWYRVVWSKAAGNSAYHYHASAHVAGTWTHTPSGNAVDGAGGTDALTLGQWVGSDDNITLAALASFEGAEWSDADVEGLDWSSMDAWLAEGPSAAWQFNQASTAVAVTDLTGGGADQTAISGTSVVADPPSFSYHGEAEEVTLTPAVLTLTAVPLTAEPQPVTVTLTPAALALAAVALSPAPGATQVTLTPAVLALAAVALSASPGVVTMVLTPAVLHLAAVVLIFPDSAVIPGHLIVRDRVANALMVRDR